ncbi:MAG: ABC transporter ATP-binding protein [Lentisphaerae bacterium]|nr:ABC transporter ATP-binding protein [Lentisphaerota bacterium]
MKPGGLVSHAPAQDRERDRRPLSPRLIARMMRYTRPYARRRNTLLLLVVARSIQLPTLAWVIGAVLGGPVSRLDPRGIWLGAAGYLALSLFTQWVLRYRSLLALRLGEDVISDLRVAMFTRLQIMPLAFFDRTRLGRIISRFTSDSETVREGVQNVLFVSLVNAGQMLFAGVYMAHYDGALFLVVAVMAPLLWLVIRYFTAKLSAAYRAMQESFSRVTATLAESVSGIRVTQGFVREKTNAGLFHELVLDHSRYNLDAARTAGVFIPLLEFKTQLFVALVLFAGGWRVLHGAAQVEDLYHFILMAGVFFGPVQSLANQYNSALAAMAGAERVFELLDREAEWTDPPGARALPAMQGRVEFRDVTFGYDPATPVLHNVSFVAEPGKTVALVGQTGSGKTSIVNLIAKFYLPTRGLVLIDGHDITALDSDALHRHMGIVMQQNFLFSGTVLENILVGRAGATREQALQAARRLDCLDLLADLPDGLNTVVGEGGAGISIGQRQLVCFTRAMLADPRILILDEATSSVDAMTEARIQDSLERLLADRTSFVVAHRLSTIRNADLVLVLDGGRIVERGAHAELLAARGAYAELYRLFIAEN